MRRESVLILGLLTTVCLIAGVMFGIWSHKWSSVMPEATPTAPHATPTGVAAHSVAASVAPLLQSSWTGQQQSILIVGVADASALHPKLEGCWIVTFSPGINKYYVLSIPPQAHFQLASLGNGQTLADIYAQDVQQDVGYRFTRDAIQSRFPAMTIEAEVTVDRADLADLATKVGGISVGGKLLVGGAVADAYDRVSFSGGAARAAFQNEAFSALFKALADQQWSPSSVAYYLSSMPHAVRPQDAAMLMQLASSAPPLQNSELTWTEVGGPHETASAP